MKKSRKKVFNGRLLKVFKGTKRLPNGKEAYLEEVAHPGAAIVIPFIKEKIVFIRQYRAVIEKYIWELPAGKLDAGERPASCAKREVEEETGYSIRNLKRLGFIYTTPGFCDEKIHIFKAECYKKKEPSTDSDEMIEVKELTKKEVRSLFKNGKLTDSKTIAALSFCGIL